MGTNSDRLIVAFDHIGPDDGADFERFASAFLAEDLPDLRPIGGMHDAGRDGVLYQVVDVADVVLQTSVTRDWANKIRETLKTLATNGISVRELIYCTPLDVLRGADAIKRELMRKRVSLDIRDRNYFLAAADTSRARADAAERLSSQFAVPLLAERTLLDPVKILLKDEEATTAATYLEVALARKEPAKALTKFSFEALVAHSLRGATVETPMSRADVRSAIVRLLEAHDAARVAEFADAALARLVKRGAAKHHQKVDAFVLGHEERQRLTAAIERAAAERVSMRRELVTRAIRTCADLGIDYAVEYEAVADDTAALAFQFLFERGRVAAEAVARDGRYRSAEASGARFAQNAIARRFGDLRSSQHMTAPQLMDVLPAVVEDVLTRPDAVIEQQLRRAADAYFLLFTLRGTPDVQKALDKLFGRASLLVDASIIIPCIAESLLPREQRRMTRLLRAAKDAGLTLIATADVLNEVRTHLERLRVGYARRVTPRVSQIGERHVALFEPLIISVYLKSHAGGSFDAFIDQLMGSLSPDQDLVEWLEQELGLKYEDFDDRFRELPVSDVGTLHSEWSERKPRRPWVQPESFDTLVYHDVRAYLFVQRERRRELGDRSRYATRWWWLTLDGVALRLDGERPQGVRVCMSPDFFASFLSVQPRTARAGSATLLPVSMEISQLGMVPAAIREEALGILQSHRGEPEYVFRRRLRDLTHAAMATRGEMANRGVEGLAEEIDDATATPISGPGDS